MKVHKTELLVSIAINTITVMKCHRMPWLEAVTRRPIPGTFHLLTSGARSVIAATLLAQRRHREDVEQRPIGIERERLDSVGTGGLNGCGSRSTHAGRARTQGSEKGSPSGLHAATLSELPAPRSQVVSVRPFSHQKTQPRLTETWPKHRCGLTFSGIISPSRRSRRSKP